MGSPSSPGKTHSNHLPLEAVEYLKAWMMSPEHVANPYPKAEERAQIMRDTGLERKQITNWFTNNRKRYWKPRVAGMSPPLTPKGDEAVHEAVTNTIAAPPALQQPVLVAQQQDHQPATAVVPVQQAPLLEDNITKFRESDVLASRLAFTRKHPGNVFYRHLVEKYSTLPNMDKSHCEKMYSIICHDRQGRFLKQNTGGTWSVMDKDAVMNKIGLALYSKHSSFISNPGVEKKRKPAKPPPEKKKRKKAQKQQPLVVLSYKAQQGSKDIHPYMLEIMTQVSSVLQNNEEALRLLDAPLKKSGEESSQERFQRLQLRHRYYAAWDGGMSPREFSSRLLEFWGGRLVETRTIVESQQQAAVVEAQVAPTAQQQQDGGEDPSREVVDKEASKGTEQAIVPAKEEISTSEPSKKDALPEASAAQLVSLSVEQPMSSLGQTLAAENVSSELVGKPVSPPPPDNAISAEKALPQLLSEKSSTQQQESSFS